MSSSPSLVPSDRERALGTGYGFSAYLLWGVLPLYFVWLKPTGPWEVVALRVLLSLVFCALLLTVMRGWGRMVAVLRNPRLALWTAVAGLLIYVNWQAFLIATQTGHVVESSLGYFINPITTVLLAVLVLHERVRPAQWAAIGIAAVAVIVIVVAYGSVPWISLILTASFGVYGLVKNRIGGAVDAVSGLALETMWLAPIAVVQLVVVAATTGLTYGQVSVGHTILLSLAGVATAIPLLLFAAGARRVSLTTVGLLQFIAPILQFLCGVVVLHEPMPVERWIGFAIVWVALVVLTVDMVRHARRSRRTVAEPIA
ncbi:EamA family transporter RarD [Microbacterium sp. NPDC055683]